jgi:hypothetical protein
MNSDSSSHTQAPDGTAPAASPAGPLGDERGTLPEELLDEWRWIYQERQTERFDQYRGQHIAVLGKRVWASGSDPELLRDHVALKYQLDPDRLVIAYIDGPV